MPSLIATVLFVGNLIFITRYMRPEGPWQRRAFLNNLFLPRANRDCSGSFLVVWGLVGAYEVFSKYGVFFRWCAPLQFIHLIRIDSARSVGIAVKCLLSHLVVNLLRICTPVCGFGHSYE